MKFLSAFFRASDRRTGSGARSKLSSITDIRADENDIVGPVTSAANNVAMEAVSVKHLSIRLHEFCLGNRDVHKEVKAMGKGDARNDD